MQNYRSSIVYVLCQSDNSILCAVSVTYYDHWCNVGVCLCTLILVCLNFSCWGQTHRGLDVNISTFQQYVLFWCVEKNTHIKFTLLTHLRQTIMKTVMAMMKTTPAAAEPMMRGSFSWILELYSSTGQERESDEMRLIFKY